MGELGGQNANSTLNTDCEFKVRIDITNIYDKVLFIHVDTCRTPLPYPTGFANYHFNPPPPPPMMNNSSQNN